MISFFIVTLPIICLVLILRYYFRNFNTKGLALAFIGVLSYFYFIYDIKEQILTGFLFGENNVLKKEWLYNVLIINNSSVFLIFSILIDWVFIKNLNVSWYNKSRNFNFSILIILMLLINSIILFSNTELKIFIEKNF